MAISAHTFISSVREMGISLFTGVPDSLLATFIDEIEQHCSGYEHIVAANEGNAIGIAAGHFLATQKPALVYLQNSGQGNSLNPLISLAHQNVYAIPMVLLVGWRGKPGTHDEPQHVEQGRITEAMFDLAGVECYELPAEEATATDIAGSAIAKAIEQCKPVALLVTAETFQKSNAKVSTPSLYPDSIDREAAIKTILDNLPRESIMVSTTGKISREVYEYRERHGVGEHGNDFLTVGSMGHASQIALGIAISKPDRNIFCIDGDGALLMHLGGTATIGGIAPPNFYHILLNNGAHDSVGGMKTCAARVSFGEVALGCGYNSATQATGKKEIARAMKDLSLGTGPLMVEVLVRKGSRTDLGRPKMPPRAYRDALLRELSDD